MSNQFMITIDLPKNVTKDDMVRYITEAVGCWKGGYSPEDPLFDLDGTSVKVKYTPILIWETKPNGS